MSTLLRSPITWFGGKGQMVDKLLPLFPAHDTYVEVFGGGGSLLFAKAPAPVECLNDANRDVQNFFRVLRDPLTFERLRQAVELSPYSRAEYGDCLDGYQDEAVDPVERARRFFVVARQSFGGRFGSGWGYEVKPAQAGAHAYLAAIERLPEIHARLRTVELECSDFRSVIRRWDTPGTLFYLDPTYHPDTCMAGGHEHELTRADHLDLVELLLEIEGRAVLSGYAHPDYAPLARAGWERRDFRVSCRSAGRTQATGIQGAGAATRMQPRVESVWISPGVQRQGRLFTEDAA